MGKLQGTKQFPCTYTDCAHSFATLQEMKSHKVEDPDHDYCKKCDVDCADWVDFTQHKVEAMAPWLESHVPPKGNPKHITCEFCGMDFKSFGGRKGHRQQEHKAEQSITCPGCDALFVRASQMIGHIERGQCPAITAREFRACVQQKYVVKEVMKHPDVFRENLAVHPSLLAPKMPGLIRDAEAGTQDGSEVGGSEVEEGGVPILDTVDPAQRGGQAPLKAEDLVEVHGKRVPLTRQNLESWPRLPGLGLVKEQVSDYLNALKLDDSAARSVAGGEQTSISDITSRRGGVKVYTESHPCLRDPPTTATTEIDNDDDARDNNSVSTARPEDVLTREPDFKSLSKRQKYTNPPKTAWSTAGPPSSRALFPTAKPAPPTTELKSILKTRDDAGPPESLNLFTTRFWDPDSSHYDPKRFYEPAIEAYTCPFPDCDMAPVEYVQELEMHFLHVHARRYFRCEAASCLRRFGTCEGLVMHLESGTKCGVARGRGFKQMLDEITGGFLKAKRLPEPAIHRPETAVARPGQGVGGLMPVLYKAKLPHQR